MSKILRLMSLCVCLLLASCAAINPTLKDPDVKLVGLRLLPAQGILQRQIAVDLSILNPNRQDLSVRGINYNVGIENINLLSGATDQVPVLRGMQETPVTLVISADIISIVRLLEHFSSNGVGDKVNYNFSAVIDFSAWLPSMHVDKKGVLPLSGSK
ncbi:LEA type 2 family protein [Cellvibrio zantedeschiae]|nr:LEA type 2 family protein [Cellvibrio zantedeschiae]